MTSQKAISSRLAILFLLAAACFPNVALAGPPLICHTIEIGDAKSLPWVSHGWNLNGGENYDTQNLVRDALEILVPNTPVIVRMETLRRASLYARKDPLAAKELLARLQAGASSAEASGHPDALAWFDVGYLAEAYKQWIGQPWMRMNKDEQNPAAGVDGYALVEKALALRGPDPQMEFAAALIALSGHPSEHLEHAQRAIASAKSDPLLARNLATHFTGPQTQIMSEVLAKNVVTN